MTTVTWRTLDALKYKHGITYEEKQALLKAQNYTCAMPDCENYATDIDHDHSCCPKRHSCSKCRRGLLCNACNQFVGRVEAILKGSTPRTRAALEYLEKWA